MLGTSMKDTSHRKATMQQQQLLLFPQTPGVPHWHDRKMPQAAVVTSCACSQDERAELQNASGAIEFLKGYKADRKDNTAVQIFRMVAGTGCQRNPSSYAIYVKLCSLPI